MCKRIHNHPAMERKLGVPEDHVIIDRELYIELVKAASVGEFKATHPPLRFGWVDMAEPPTVPAVVREEK